MTARPVVEPLRLYDRLADEVREFSPTGDSVRLYVCGITPYDATHLGHAFTFVSFDVLIRYLRYLGYPVRYVQNVTDIDDPLFAKARELGMPYEKLAAEETAQYDSDMAALNVIPPDVFPRASGEIEPMIALVERLFAAGRAYHVDDYVYFNIAALPGYGRLSRCDREEMIALARERGGDPDDPRRRDPLDFVLWRPAAPGEPAWESPWGPGLPGWHLECSTMALEYLGAPLDIHGGGEDLIFPHHENEIAQSEVVSGIAPFARFWVHTGMVYMDGEKMSKSLGNMVFVRDLLPRYGADALRLYLSGYHYRDRPHWDEDRLARAAVTAVSLAAAANTSSGSLPGRVDSGRYHRLFEEWMSRDLDTSAAIGVLRDLAHAIRSDADAGLDVREPQALLRELGGVLGLRLEG